jgi:hypothetical protein
VTLTPQPQRAPGAPAELQVTYAGVVYPADELAGGAAYELFSAEPADGFTYDGRPGARLPYRRVVHVTDVAAVDGAPPAPHSGQLDPPLVAPLSQVRGWAEVHRLSQTPAAGHDPFLIAVRQSAAIRRGTRMIKVLSPRHVAGLLSGWLPYGFCYREYDVAHLRTPAELALLRTDVDAGRDGLDAAYVLRWRAADPVDYEIPHGDCQRGLVDMPPHDRVGPPVLGTGFTPSGRHLIPEYLTRDVADLPLPASASLLAYSPEGIQVVLYTYQPEQRGWLRMVGPQWRHLLAAVPGVSPEQEYVPNREAARSTQLVGTFRGQEYEAIADPPEEFRVLAMTRAARYPVDTVARRARYVTWRNAPCLVLREESDWLRVRLCRPDQHSVAALGAQCYERGVYESWAPAAEVTDDRVADVTYPI